MGPPAGDRRISVDLGRWLFRWRSLTPLPVIALLAGLDRLSSHPFSPLPTAWAGAAVALCILGEALRATVRGVVPLNTSSQGLRLGAASLNTGGAYRFTRNPLYLGNLLIFAGLLALAFGPARNPLGAALGLSFFFVEYYFIILAEEDFLATRFGEAYRDYCRKVPRFWPRPIPAATRGSMERFAWPRALRTEHNGAAAWIFGATVLIALRGFAEREAVDWRDAGPASAALLLLGAVYLIVKGWKRGWWLRAARGGADNP
jgi:protein-S-isoprenylcysteine O-methyltransferase Ste14